MTIRFRAVSVSAIALSALLLAGCSRQDDSVVAEDASVEDVAKQVSRSDIRPKPGKWESRMRITKIEMPGVPPDVQNMMNSQLGKAQTSVTCLTKEQAEANDGELFKPEDNPNCTYNKFEMGGGKIAADMTCAQGESSQNMKMSGTYSDEAYDMQVNAEGKMEGKPMSMAMAVASKRIGDCE